MHSTLVLLTALVGLGPLMSTAPGGALIPVDTWWNPDRQNAYMHQVCAAASTAIDLDECQYVAESHIDNLRECIRRRSPYAAICARMLPEAEQELAEVNADPVLLEHRQEQREEQRRGAIRSACASANGGYFAGSYIPCVRQQGVDP